MPSINKCIVLLTLALSAMAASHGQHMARGAHRDISARSPVAAPEVAQLGNVQKRASNSKRCKARPTSSSLTSTSHSSTKTSSTPKATSSSSSKKEANVDTGPTTTSSSTPKWTPPATSSSVKKETPTSSSKAATSTGSSGGSAITGGVGTYFTQNGVEGACGKVNPDSAIICALDTILYAGGALCGSQIKVTNLKNGNVVTVTVADECPTCGGRSSVDFSVGAFKALGGTVEEGEFPISFIMI